MCLQVIITSRELRDGSFLPSLMEGHCHVSHYRLRGISRCSPCISPAPTLWPPSSPASCRLTSCRGGSATGSPAQWGLSYRYTYSFLTIFSNIGEVTPLFKLLTVSLYLSILGCNMSASKNQPELPPHSHSLPLHLQPARPLQHFPGNTHTHT